MLLEDRLLLADIRYIGGTGSDWSTAANWEGGSKPGENDTAVLTATSPAVTVDTDISVAGLRMEAGYNAAVTAAAAKTLTVTVTATQAGGTVDGEGTLKITGTFSWTGGAQRGTGTTRLEGTSTLDTNAKTLDARRLENAGTLTWLVGNLTVSNGAKIVNSATFHLKADSSILNGGGAASTFTNSGTFRKNESTGISQVQATFSNTGTVQADTGTLNFGVFTNKLGGTIDGAGTVGIFDTFTWEGGTIQDTSTEKTGTLNLATITANFTTENIKYLRERPVVSNATVNWIDGDLVLWISSRSFFINQGTFNIQDGNLEMRGSPDGQFLNTSTGIINVDAGNDSVLIRLGRFNNDGTFNCNSGHAIIQSTGNHTGRFNAAANATISFDGNGTARAVTFAATTQGAPSLTGSGWYDVKNRMTLVIDQTALGPDNFEIGLNGTLSGSGTLQANSWFLWGDGDMTGSGATVISANASMEINAAANRQLDARQLNIQGVAYWFDGDIAASNGATIRLDGTAANGNGTFSIQCDQTIEHLAGTPAPGKFTIDNGGVLEKSWGNGLTDIQMDVETSNQGKVDAMGRNLKVKSQKNVSGIIETNGGTLTVAEGFEQQGGSTSVALGTLAVLGSFTQAGGATAVTGSGSLLSVAGAFEQTGGSLTLSGTGGRLSVTNSVVASGSAVLTLQNGLLDAIGGVTIQAGATLNGYGGTVTANVINAGTFNLSGGVYTLAISGNYTQTGTLKVSLASSSSYSRLVVSGLAALGGTLHVDLLGGFMPAPGMQFSVLTYGSRSGTFGALELPALGFGRWDPRYDNPTGTFTLAVTYF